MSVTEKQILNCVYSHNNGHFKLSDNYKKHIDFNIAVLGIHADNPCLKLPVVLACFAPFRHDNHAKVDLYTPCCKTPEIRRITPCTALHGYLSLLSVPSASFRILIMESDP